MQQRLRQVIGQPLTALPLLPPLASQAWNSATGNDASVLIGVEDIFKRNLTATAAGAWGVQSGRIGVQFEQWTLAGAPNHPAFCSMPELVRWAGCQQAG